MSTVTVTLAGVPPEASSRYSALVRIRPATGRAIERRLATPTESIAVPPGQGSVEVVFSSGATELRDYTVADGADVQLTFSLPASPHEWMEYLSLSRSWSASPTPVTRHRIEPVGLVGTFVTESVLPLGLAGTPASVDDATWSIEERGGAVTVDTATATDGRVRALFIRDRRSPNVLSARDGSALWILRVTMPSSPRNVRVCVLPIPLGRGTDDRETHVALGLERPDPLPDVHVVPRDADLAAVLGFLERGDQRALASLEGDIVAWARRAMQGKRHDPITAAIGLAILLRLGKQSAVEGWSENLWRWYPGLPDGGALHAAVLLQTAATDIDAWHAELRKAVIGSCRAGVPLLTDSLRHLLAATSVLRGVEPPDAEVEAAAAHCERLARALSPDTVFTTLTLPAGDVARVWGPPNHEARTMEQIRLERLQADFAKILDALRTRADVLTATPGLAAARPGFITDGGAMEPCLVLAFHPDRPVPDPAMLGFDVPVRVVVASPAEQLEGADRPTLQSALRSLLNPELAAFAPPFRGTYQPPSGPGAPTLATIEQPMRVTLCASPDAGWPVLRDFLGKGVGEQMTVAMYDFTAPHVADAVRAALGDGPARLRLVFDGRPAGNGLGGNGVNGPDSPEAVVVERLRQDLGDRLVRSRASVGSGRAVPSAYHIKVASVDGERLWLSSGNWQSSNLAPWDFQVAGSAPPLPLYRYNRDYHVVLESAALARTYAAFIEYDGTLGADFAAAAADEEPEAGPYLLVPEEPEEVGAFAPAIQRFAPLTLDETVRVTPLLTPDNFPKVVIERLSGAKRRVWIQNQYVRPRPGGGNFPEFDRLVQTLGALAEKVDLRLCLRDVSGAERDYLLAAGVRLEQIRRQSNCHAKLIVIDDDVVIVGSQNLSNDGFVANRDASLLFENVKATDYFATILDVDWRRASSIADGADFGVRVATSPGDVRPGYRTVAWSALFDGPPPAPANPPPVAPGNAEVVEIPAFGVDRDGNRRVEVLGTLATALRSGQGAPDPDADAVGRTVQARAFGLPPGASADDLEDTGWGIIWAPGTPQATKAALRPLLDLRGAQVGDPDLLREFDYVPGETARMFLQRNKTDFGTIKPPCVPLYLLLVGGPGEIPFAFQQVLDVEYRVGRLHLPSDEAYQAYADAVVKVETGGSTPRARVLHSFGPAHPGDAPTSLSAKVLVGAAADWVGDDAPKSVRKLGVASAVDVAGAATKARLGEILRGTTGRPELLFTAGHGLADAPGALTQTSDQGALVTADWDGFGAIGADALFSAADVPADADLLGMVAFLFACYSVGTPQLDSFPSAAPSTLAPAPFVAALPKALLGHPRGGALGVFGHVDRALVWSLQPPGVAADTTAFARAAQHVLVGSPLGAALEELNVRGASLAAEVSRALAPGAAPLADADLVRTWIQQRDACAYILLGDPAARLPR